MQARIRRFGPFERFFLGRLPPVERTLRKRVNIGGDVFLFVLSKTTSTNVLAVLDPDVKIRAAKKIYGRVFVPILDSLFFHVGAVVQ